MSGSQSVAKKSFCIFTAIKMRTGILRFKVLVLPL